MCLRLRALKHVAPGKSVGPDKLESFFLRSALDFIAELPRYMVNLSLSSNEIPNIWKSAHVLRLLKGVNTTAVNNYRPISKLRFLAKSS